MSSYRSAEVLDGTTTKNGWKIVKKASWQGWRLLRAFSSSRSHNKPIEKTETRTKGITTTSEELVIQVGGIYEMHCKDGHKGGPNAFELIIYGSSKELFIIS